MDEEWSTKLAIVISYPTCASGIIIVLKLSTECTGYKNISNFIFYRLKFFAILRKLFLDKLQDIGFTCIP